MISVFKGYICDYSETLIGSWRTFSGDDCLVDISFQTLLGTTGYYEEKKVAKWQSPEMGVAGLYFQKTPLSNYLYGGSCFVIGFCMCCEPGAPDS